MNNRPLFAEIDRQSAAYFTLNVGNGEHYFPKTLAQVLYCNIAISLIAFSPAIASTLRKDPDLMPANNDFAETFRELRAILKPYEKKLIVVHDTDSNYYLDTHRLIKPKYRLFFGAVKLGKAYVSFHLMPVYANAELVEKMSPQLKQHMQGKSCFNFKKVDAILFKELAAVTKKGFALFHDKKFLEKITR